MKFNLLFAGAGLAMMLSSCSTPDWAEVGDPLEPGVRYEVRKALPLGASYTPRDVPGHYFMVDDSLHDDGAMTPLADAGGPTVRAVRTTAYCHTESDHIRWGSLAAAGAPLRFGMVCSAAADWSRYPLGTRFTIKSQPNVVYEVDDYGRALVGSGTIDLYRPTMGSMNAWGVRNVEIEITHWGSYEDSMRLMRDRSQYPHVRHMMLDIQRKMEQASAFTPDNPMPATVMPTVAPTAVFGALQNPGPPLSL